MGGLGTVGQTATPDSMTSGLLQFVHVGNIERFEAGCKTKEAGFDDGSGCSRCFLLVMMELEFAIGLKDGQ